MNARLQQRAVVDHLGFFRGKNLGWSEDWSDVAIANNPKSALGGGVLGGRWSYALRGPISGGVSVTTAFDQSGVPAQFVWPRTPALMLTTPNTGISTSKAHVETFMPVGTMDPSGVLSFQWDVALWDIDSTDTEIAMGFSSDSLIADASRFSTSAPIGAAFSFRATVDGTSWKLYTRQQGSSAVYASPDSTLATTVDHRRFRIDIIGANVADASADHVVFIADGNVVKDVAVDLTNGTAGGFWPRVFFQLNATGAGGAEKLAIGTNDFRTNLWPGSVAT